MIQLIQFKKNLETNSQFEVNTFETPKNFRDYEINIIDLSHEEIWSVYDKDDTTNLKNKLNIVNKLNTIRSMIEGCCSTVIIILPQDINFTTSKWRSGANSSTHHLPIKENLEYFMMHFKEILTPLSQSLEFKLVYAPTETMLNEINFPSSFLFKDYESSYQVSLNAKDSNSIVSIKRASDDTYLTTLELATFDTLNSFLCAIGVQSANNKEIEPAWVKKEKMFDDEILLGEIQKNKQLIDKSRSNINTANIRLKKNAKYKSILYTNGDELVDVVSDILQEMLGCDLSGFEDVKKEDVRFTINGKIILGEIKGITPNVKAANLAQLNMHVSNYEDDNPEEKVDNIYPILFINHQRNKPLDERAEIDNSHIKNAKERYDCLIVETITLLKMFEKYKNEELTRERCINLILNKKGILKIEDLK